MVNFKKAKKQRPARQAVVASDKTKSYVFCLRPDAKGGPGWWCAAPTHEFLAHFSQLPAPSAK
jgi:hypothetical protein